MDGLLQLLEHVVVHLVAAGAEALRVGQLERGVEGAPEAHPGDEAAEREKAEAEIDAGAGQDRASQRSRASSSPAAISASSARRCAARCSIMVSMSTNTVLDQRASTSSLRHVALGAEVAARRDGGQGSAGRGP